MNGAITTLAALAAVCEEFSKSAGTEPAPPARVQLTAFRAWLDRADPGAGLEYHRGHLSNDRSPTSTLPAERRRALARVADAALQAAERHQVRLVQRRQGACDFSYLAIKPARPLIRRAPWPDHRPYAHAA